MKKNNKYYTENFNKIDKNNLKANIYKGNVFNEFEHKFLTSHLDNYLNESNNLYKVFKYGYDSVKKKELESINKLTEQMVDSCNMAAKAFTIIEKKECDLNEYLHFCTQITKYNSGLIKKFSIDIREHYLEYMKVEEQLFSHFLKQKKDLTSFYIESIKKLYTD